MHEAEGDSIVRLRDISKSYGDLIVLNRMTLDIRKGEFLTLLGSSGSGKTTLLNIIAGITSPSEGRVYIGGRDMTETPPSKRGLGMVFQSYALMPHMSVFQNIAFPLRVRRLPEDEIASRVKSVLHLVKLDHVEQRKPAELSGGQQQRVSLARSIVYEPDVILMDEPLGALDRNLREHMQVEIKRIHRETGMTFLYVTHDQEEALTMSDRIMLMNKGEIEQIGSPEQLYRFPVSCFAGRFIGAANIIPLKRYDIESATLPDGSKALLHNSREAVGEGGFLLIRPEHCLLRKREDEVPGGFNRVVGTVESALMVGPAVRYFVSVGSGEPFMVPLPIDQNGPGFGSGTEIEVLWKPENAQLLTH